MQTPRPNPKAPVPHLFRRFWRAEEGAVAVLAAVMMPVIILAAGLWVETGYWYQQQRKVQYAADVAAIAAGVRIRAGDGAAGYTAAARFVAGQADVSLTAPDTVITVSFPYQGNRNRVEVRIEEAHSRFFTALFATFFPDRKVRVHGRAVAMLVGREATSGCVLALAKRTTDALAIGGSSDVELKGCDLSSNSAHPSFSASVDGNAVFSANCLRAVGGISFSRTQGLAAGCPVAYAPPSRDPYAAVPMPSLLGLTCSDRTFSPNGDVTVAGTYMAAFGTNVRCFRGAGANSFIDIKGKVTLEPGLYIFDANLRFTAGGSGLPAELDGSRGVTLYFTDGNSMVLNGQAKLTLAPPTPANQPPGTNHPYMGITILGDRGTAKTETFQINGPDNSISIQGAVYTPSSAINYSGNSSSTTSWTDSSTTNDGCTQIIADTVTFTGSSNLASDCTGMGTQPLYSYETVELLE